MCAIIGAVFSGLSSGPQARAYNQMLNVVAQASLERGVDGFGFVSSSLHWPARESHTHSSRSVKRGETDFSKTPACFLTDDTMVATVVGNMRAEPTTEFVEHKNEFDQQPYQLNGWSIAHNGTIANDKELRTGALETTIDSAAIVERLADSTYGTSKIELWSAFKYALRALKGSFAIIATHEAAKDMILVGANYRPIWYIRTPNGLVFASARHYFPKEYVPQMIEPYTMQQFVVDDRGNLIQHQTAYLSRQTSRKALVVCSGGMDSVVAACAALDAGYQIELIHFQYGSRAEGPEVRAVQEVAEHLDVACTLFPLPVYKPGDSPLLQADSTIAGGEAGAEFAHEWVPARNLLLLSVATAYAEANGFDTLVLGNNLEEAGAYPDNEPEFIARFNDMLPFAVGDGKSMKIIMPVGNKMKHEIVALGDKLGAPLHLTWSCYRAGAKHCGTCGPCYMRRTAFRINNLPEVIEYNE